MLPAAHRLRTAADFQETTRRGAKASRGPVVAYVLAPGRDDTVLRGEPARLGTVVSKKVGGSVTRHRAARRIRGAAAPLVGALPAGSRIVIRALPGADRDAKLALSVREAVSAAVDRAYPTRAPA